MQVHEKPNKLCCCLSSEIGAVITSIFIILEGIALLLGSIACLVVKFKALSASLVFCYYALIIFIVLPFASFLVYAGSIAIYGVRKRRYTHLNQVLIASALCIIAATLMLVKTATDDDVNDETHLLKSLSIILIMLHIYFFGVQYEMFREFLLEASGIVEPSKLLEEDDVIYEF